MWTVCVGPPLELDLFVVQNLCRVPLNVVASFVGMNRDPIFVVVH